MLFPLALLVIAGALALLLRGVEVRLVLFGAGLALATLALKPWVVLDVFRDEMGNGKTIGPVCSAMGYAYVLRATGCDRALVRCLLQPVRRARWLLVPAGCAVGFVTNIAITSQTGAAAAVGAVLIPLMLAAGYRPVTAAATLVLGCSGGGSLLNPGDADLVALQRGTQAAMSHVLHAMSPPLALGFAAAVLTFAITAATQRREPIAPEGNPPPPDPASEPINYWKVLLPPLPVVMMFLMLPTFGLFPPLLKLYDQGLPVSHAMLLSSLLVALVHWKDFSAQARSYFEGMGYGYAQIISLIITAACFIEGMKAVGLIEHLVGLVTGAGVWGRLGSGGFTCLLGVISGSGIAPSVAFSQAVLPGLATTDPHGALNLGVWAAIAATFGRTMSPVAAVVIYTSTLTNATPVDIVKRTAPPLFVGAAVAFAALWWR